VCGGCVVGVGTPVCVPCAVSGVCGVCGVCVLYLVCVCVVCDAVCMCVFTVTSLVRRETSRGATRDTRINVAAMNSQPGFAGLIIRLTERSLSRIENTKRATPSHDHAVAAHYDYDDHSQGHFFGYLLVHMFVPLWTFAPHLLVCTAYF
jgi:hypothetical protein